MYCVLCIAYCVLCIVHCVLCVAYCVLCIAYCVLRIVYCVFCISITNHLQESRQETTRNPTRAYEDDFHIPRDPSRLELALDPGLKETGFGHGNKVSCLAQGRHGSALHGLGPEPYLTSVTCTGGAPHSAAAFKGLIEGDITAV